MEIIDQIKDICNETENEWFLTHEFTKLALFDLKFNEQFENQKIQWRTELNQAFNDGKIEYDELVNSEWEWDEIERSEELDKLDLYQNLVYDNNKGYIESKWIIPDRVDGKIPGFILIKCSGVGIGDDDLFTHCLEFACVRPEYRNQGVLKGMINQIPKEWNIWLEASSCEIKNVENIWKKCGFQYHTNIRGHLIYKTLSTHTN